MGADGREAQEEAAGYGNGAGMGHDARLGKRSLRKSSVCSRRGDGLLHD